MKKQNDIISNILKDLSIRGFSVIHNFFSSDDLALLNQETDRLFSEQKNKIEILDKENCSKDQRIFGAEKFSAHIRNKFMNNSIFTEVLKSRYGSIDKNRRVMINKLVFSEKENRSSGGGFHRDNHDKQMKIITYLSDVTLQNGNFQFVTNSSKKHIGFPPTRTKNYRTRYTDEVVNQLTEQKNCQILDITGSAGTTIVVDTTYIHRGKIIEEGTRKAITLYCF